MRSIVDGDKSASCAGIKNGISIGGYGRLGDYNRIAREKCIATNLICCPDLSG